MLKISKIEFIKNVFDESLSHHVFSIANISFSNYEPINGALLFWQENKEESMYTKHGEYKFFYDMDETKYYASVKFPKHCMLTRDQKQELAYILLEQRGAIGSYSIETNKNAANVMQIHRLYRQLVFPIEFSSEHFKYVFQAQYNSELEQFQLEHPFYTTQFIKDYVKWMGLVCQAHPSHFEKYIDKVQMTQVCYQNEFLTETFLLKNLPKIDWSTLQYNLPVLDRLSKSFKMYLLKQLHDEGIQQIDIQMSPNKFIEDREFYKDERVIYLPLEEESQLVNGPFHFFSYDRGRYIWPGSEHMIKSIPSFASQLYDIHGDRKLTNKEMDKIYDAFSSEQRYLFETSCELHWLNRYKDQMNWTNISELNHHLNDEFIEKHLKYINFEALAKNTQISLSSQFVEKHVLKLKKPTITPLLLANLTEELYCKYKQSIPLHLVNIKDYEQSLSVEQIELIERLLEEQ